MQLKWPRVFISFAWSVVIMWTFIGLVSFTYLILGVPYQIGISLGHWFLILAIILIDMGIRRNLPADIGEYKLLSRFNRHFFPLFIASGLLLILWERIDLFWDDDVHFITAYGYRIKWGVAAGLVGIYVTVNMGTELLRKWRDSLAENERFQKENVQTRLATLKSQVNPHFLFNSLNTLSGLIHEDPHKASAFLRKISGVYRHILEARDKDLITLGEELNIARDYMELIHVRFEGTVSIELQVEPTAVKKQVVPLCLQMLMENAIKHNRASQDEPLVIHIRTVDDIWLEVENNLQARRTLEVSTKVGLRNIKARFGYLSDRRVQIEESESRFIVRLPLIQPT